jgi:hypothetical protein
VIHFALGWEVRFRREKCGDICEDVLNTCVGFDGSTVAKWCCASQLHTQSRTVSSLDLQFN